MPMTRRIIPWVAALAVVAVAVAASAATPRHPIDERDVGLLASKHPTALALLVQGGELALAGKVAQALEAFQEAAEEAPDSALLARRQCQALTSLGKRAEAMPMCMRAVKGEASAMNLRAMVAATMSGQVPPTTTELAQAMRFARRARDSMPDEPWGYAAECDIAERIGDAKMLEGCLRELQRVAPGHYETVRALAIAAPRTVTWRVWVGWSIIFLLAAATGFHAFWRWARASGRRPGVAAASAAVLVLCIGSTLGVAHAEGDAPPAAARAPAPAPEPEKGMLSQWPINDNDPSSSVPTEQKKQRNPLQFGYWLMDLTFKAAAATKRGDHEAAIGYYKALVKAVPDRSVSFTRLCESYEAAGHWQEAMEACANALTAPGVTVQEYAHYFTLALAKKGPLTSQEVDVLDKVIAHLQGDPNDREIADDLQCQLGVRQEDVPLLEQCTSALAVKAPDDPRTISFLWALAIAKGNLDEAQALIARARTSTMKPEGIEEMERGLASIRERQRHSAYAWGFGGLGVLLASVGAVVFMTRRGKGDAGPPAAPLASEGGGG